MNPSRPSAPAVLARTGNLATLAAALHASRTRTLGMLQAWREQLGNDLSIAYDACLNPPRWELGHLGWFEEWWLARNPQRALGWRADPAAPRAAPLQPHGDRWYDSSHVEHQSRWSLDLPHVERIVDDVTRQRERTLELLSSNGDKHNDDTLYFFRLALLHEHMHAEAWVMMAQQLGMAPGDALALAEPTSFARSDRLHVPAGGVELGCANNAGFAFDNECGRQHERFAAFDIDAQPVTWARYLPFIDAAGYADARWWTADGWAWREAQAAEHPQHLRATSDGRWQQRRFDRWLDLDLTHAASHLSLHEAQAWCRWAGRALPTEAQWCAAQHLHGNPAVPRAVDTAVFAWGEVWEWTASPFTPFEGFVAHPYRDYSQPWFDGRPVLKGASAWTHPDMRHPAYRNFYLSHRTDVLAGFRSVSGPAG